MSLKENLRNMLKAKSKAVEPSERIKGNKNNVLLYVVAMALTLVTIACAVIIILRNAEKKRDLRESEASLVEKEASVSELESAYADELSKTTAQLEFDRLREEYDLALENCNKAIQEYDTFLLEIEAYSFKNLPGSMNQVKSEWPPFDEYYKNGVGKEALERLTQGVMEKQTEVEKTSADASLIAYNVAVNDYNTILDVYLAQTQKVSLDFLQGVQANPRKKQIIEKWIRDVWSRTDAVSRISWVVNETNELVAMYLMALQLENPSKEWVMERLLKIDDVVQQQAVTKDNDPNGLLSLDGGYTSCIYFTTMSVSAGSVQGVNPVAKGTDGGGAIEVFATLEDAKCRCDYLGRYDGTLLYSGSYALLGTMVIRTSYLLSNQEQIELTNKIMEAMTELQ